MNEAHQTLLAHIRNTKEEIAAQKEEEANLIRRIAQTKDDRIAALYEAELTRITDSLSVLSRKLETQEKGGSTQAEVMDRIRETTEALQTREPLDTMTREEKRAVLKALGVRVFMYPRHSEFARTHETRWDFTFPDPTEA